MKKIILASASPRRRELLGMLGLEFDIMADSSPEDAGDAKTPEETVRTLARLKCGNIADICDETENTLIIAADTVVALNGEILGKPKNEGEAYSFLRALSGCEHEVYTGVCVTDTESGKKVDFCEKCKVVFRELDENEIRAYIASGEPMDKAGAYGIQGFGALLVREIQGDYFTVVGLPLCRLAECLKSEFGVKILR